MSDRGHDAGVPVVVVGEGLNCLGIVRSLGGVGIPVIAVTSSHRTAVGCSRLASVRTLRSLDGSDLVDGLLELAAEFGGVRPVLMLGGDRQVALASEARQRLAPHYRLSLPPADVVRILADKAQFQRFAESRRLPVPRTVVITDAESLLGLADLALPVVIKPADKAKVLAGHADRAVRADTLTDARAAAARMAAAAGSVVAQEWIEGSDSDIFFALFVCDLDNRIRGLFCGRKLVCAPPQVGSTAVCAPAGPEAPEVARLAAQFVAETGYRGIGGIEFKRDARDGRFLIVEPTVGRTDWQSEVATLNGVNLPLLAMHEALELPGSVRDAASPPGLAAMPAIAWRSSLGHRRPTGGSAAGLRVADGYFRVADPLPGLYYYVVEAFAHRVRRRLARLVRMPPHSPETAIERSISPP